MTLTNVTELTAVEAVARALEPEPDDEHYGRSSRTSADYWTKCSFDEAVRMTREGYPYGLTELRRKLDSMPPDVRPNLRPMPVWGPSGSAVDMGRYLSGEPDAMIETVRGRRQSLVLKVGIERAVSAHVTAADILATGASVLAVIERLRTAGVAAELWVTFTQCASSSRSGDTYQLRVKVQDASRPIDLAVLAFWTMHPAALRRIAFGVEEREPAPIRRGYGFGTSLGVYGYPTVDGGAFDEYAPARADEVEGWIRDVLARRS